MLEMMSCYWKETKVNLKIASNQVWKLSNIHTYKSCIRHTAWCVVFSGDSPTSMIILTLRGSRWPRWKELAGLDTEDATWRCSAGMECCMKDGNSQMLGILPAHKGWTVAPTKTSKTSIAPTETFFGDINQTWELLLILEGRTVILPDVFHLEPQDSLGLLRTP